MVWPGVGTNVIAEIVFVVEDGKLVELERPVVDELEIEVAEVAMELVYADGLVIVIVDGIIVELERPLWDELTVAV